MIIIGSTGYVIQISRNHPAYAELMLLPDNTSKEQLNNFCEENDINIKWELE